MFTKLKSVPQREIAKWCAYGLALLAPGSFIVLPLLLLGRTWMRRGARPARTRRPTRFSAMAKLDSVLVAGRRAFAKGKN